MDISVDILAILLIIFIFCIFTNKRPAYTTLELRSRGITVFTVEYDDQNENPIKQIKIVDGGETLRFCQSSYTRDLKISWKSEEEKPKVIFKCTIESRHRKLFDYVNISDDKEGVYKMQVPFHQVNSCFIECISY